MKIDTYTKIILTIIAASPLWLCGQTIVRPNRVSAQGPVSVRIDSISGLLTPFPVEIKSISPSVTPIDVRVR